jgi:hypothetical protein
MTTGNTTLLGLALPVQGELSGTWGDVINNYMTQYLDSAIAGTNTLSTDADVTLTKTTGATLTTASSQYSVLLCTGSRAAQRTITAPAVSKSYTIINLTTGGFAVKIVGAGPTTGVTVANGTVVQVVWNGSDFVSASIVVGTAGAAGNILTSTGTTFQSGGGAATPPSAVTFNATAMVVNCLLSNVFSTTFTANVTVAPTISNPVDGQTVNWFITQDGTGSRTMTWPSSFKWSGGIVSALSTGANAVDLLVITYRSTTGFWYASLAKGFA